MKDQCDKAVDASKRKLCSQMKVVFHMAKNDIPRNQYTGMTELLRAVQAPDLATSEGLYRHSDSICEMEMALEDVVLKQLDDKIRESDFIGIIIDETVDITVDKKLIVYVKLQVSGRVETCFLGNYDFTLWDGSVYFCQSSGGAQRQACGAVLCYRTGLGWSQRAGVGALVNREYFSFKRTVLPIALC